MGIQIKVQNFRCLRNVDWSPDGVCVLVGPNGSGKTTLFNALKFLERMYQPAATQSLEMGGPYFRNLDAPPDEPVSFALKQGVWTWTLTIPPGTGPFEPSFGETLVEDSETIISKSPGQQGFTFQGNSVTWLVHGFSAFATVIRTPFLQSAQLPTRAYDLPARAADFTATIEGFSVYGSYANQQLREGGSQITGDLQLSINGNNAFAVLRNWRDKRDFRAAYDFVVEAVCEAFPGVADEIEFDVAATVTSLRLITAGRKDTIPVTFAPNGWLAGLLHLMAVAGAKRGTVVTIDEFENSLHPYAIRRLINAMREWAAKKQLTVVVAGHSSALLDEFKEFPSHVFVMEPWHSEKPTMPLRLTDYRDPEWLNHFSLGELYRHEEFGGPKDVPPNGVPVVSA